MANSPSNGPRSARKGVKTSHRQKTRRLVAAVKHNHLSLEVYKQFLRGSAIRAVKKARQS